jgi:hypothetical protein
MVDITERKSGLDKTVQTGLERPDYVSESFRDAYPARTATSGVFGIAHTSLLTSERGSNSTRQSGD